MKVLIIEDEAGVASFVSRALSESGFEPSVELTGWNGVRRLRAESFDLVILDLMLPEIGGLEILQTMRLEGDTTPVLLLTAKSNTEDRVDGLDAGADDYLVKPFDVAELIARVRVLLRRGTRTILRYGDLTLDRSSRTADRNGRRIYLSSTETALLEFLMANPHKPLSKGAVLEAVWNDPYASNPNVVEVYISHLRSKTELKDEPRLIHTVRGKGYMLSSEEP